MKFIMRPVVRMILSTYMKVITVMKIIYRTVIHSMKLTILKIATKTYKYQHPM